MLFQCSVSVHFVVSHCKSLTDNSYIVVFLQLPGLMHMADEGRVWWGRFVMINLGFVLSFTALLLLALFEHELNDII